MTRPMTNAMSTTPRRSQFGIYPLVDAPTTVMAKSRLGGEDVDPEEVAAAVAEKERRAALFSTPKVHVSTTARMASPKLEGEEPFVPDIRTPFSNC
ncbi:MAG TPA: hypothetical protein VD770_04685 [Coxiellaceae bacterium]|nr:hypothetical protein [Coxiellaceae bacterium]